MRDRLLVTGARGQLGTDLVAEFRRRADVVGCDLDDFDITDPAAVRQHGAAVRPTVVIHAAAFTEVDRCEAEPERAIRVNADGAAFVAEACRAVGAHLVFYSTDYVFDGARRTPYVESAPPNPRTVYGRSKLEGERRTSAAQPDSAILRLAWMYGAHGRNFVVTMLARGAEQLEAARRGESIASLQVVDDQVGNPTWTRDVVRQTEIVLRERLTGLYHCSAEGETSWYGLAAFIFSRLGMAVDLRPCTTAALGRPAPRPAYSSLENAALKAAGCHVMRDWREALAEFLAGRREAALYAV